MSSTIEAALDEYLADQTNTSSEVERGQAAKRTVIKAGSDAVPIIEARLLSGSFEHKRRCFGLLIEMANQISNSIARSLPDKPPLLIIWETAVLIQVGEGFDRAPLFDLLKHPDPYLRHLSALAIAFQGLGQPAEAPRLIPVLIDALRSEAKIEGSQFPVAGGSLACLSKLASSSFLPDGRAIEIYNSTWAFPPPVLPFPLTAIALSGAEREQTILEVDQWWRANQATFRLPRP